jgi:predicted secreted acid phosphatase
LPRRQSARWRSVGLRREPLSGRPAIVLDIDETSLSNYTDLSARNFDVSALAVSAVASHGVAIQPTLQLYRYALAHGVALVFVTGRPSAIDSITASNLRHAGYDRGWTALHEKPVNAGTERFKSSTRAAIERRGYDIIANVGDQQSDLDGGNADRDFKLPDPFYFISD